MELTGAYTIPRNRGSNRWLRRQATQAKGDRRGNQTGRQRERSEHSGPISCGRGVTTSGAADGGHAAAPE